MEPEDDISSEHIGLRPTPSLGCFRPIATDSTFWQKTDTIALSHATFMPNPEDTAVTIGSAFYFLNDTLERRLEQLATRSVTAITATLKSSPAANTTSEQDDDGTGAYSRAACCVLDVARTKLAAMFNDRHTSAHEALEAFRLAAQTGEARTAHFIMTLLTHRHKAFLCAEVDASNSIIRQFASLDGNDTPATLASLAVDSRHLPTMRSCVIDLTLNDIDGELGDAIDEFCPPDLQAALRRSMETRARAALRLVECIPTIAILSALCHKYDAKREVACDALATLLNDAQKKAHVDDSLLLFQLRSLLKPPSPHTADTTKPSARKSTPMATQPTRDFLCTSAFSAPINRQIADS